MRTLAIIVVLLWATPAATQNLLTLELPPALVGYVATPNDAYDVLLKGNYAYVPDYASGLQVIDVSSPTLPVIVGSYDTPGYAVQVCIVDDVALVADHEIGGLQVLDISQAIPTFLGEYINGQTIVGVGAAAGVVAVGYIEGYLEILDISTPTKPAVVGAYDTPGTPRHFAFLDNYLLVVDHTFGLIVLDISDPSVPTMVGQLATNGRPVGLEVHHDLVYLAGGASGVQVLSIASLASPSLLGAVALPGPAVKVAVQSLVAFVADHVNGGLQVVDVASPHNPVTLGGYVTGFYAHGIAVREQHAYLADGDGLKVFRVFTTATGTNSPTTHSVGKPFPNPFTSRTRLKLPHTHYSTTTASVFDATGRRVSKLLLRDRSGVVEWNGLDDRGRPAPGGVYFIKVNAGGLQHVRKVTLLR